MRTAAATIIISKQYEINNALLILPQLLFQTLSSKIKRRTAGVYRENAAIVSLIQIFKKLN